MPDDTAGERDLGSDSTPSPWTRLIESGQGLGGRLVDEVATDYTVTDGGVMICNRCGEHVWDAARHEEHRHTGSRRPISIAETHVHTDDELRAAITVRADEPGPLSDNEMSQLVVGLPAGVFGSSNVHDAIITEATRVRDVEVAREEALARASLTARVRDAIAAHLEGHRGVVHGPSGIQQQVYVTAAEAAVEVFLEMLRNPAAMMHHSDGTVDVRDGG